MNWKRIPESQGWLQSIGEWAIRQHTFMPRMIDLEVSRICNLGCPICTRRVSSSLAQSRKNIPFCTLERFKEMYKEIPTIGTLSFMGDGEPLMNPELPDLIRYTSLQNINTVITTNGTLVTSSMVAHWKANRVYRVHVSVDASTKVKFEALRIGAEWEKVVENLSTVGRSGIPLCVNMVIMEHNMEEMPGVVRLCKEVGAREVTFIKPICAYGTDTGVMPGLSRRNQEIFKETAEVCKLLGVKWVFPLTLNPTWRRLSFPFIRPEISIEGDVFACCYTLGRSKVWVGGYEYTVPSYNMGNMFREGFRKIWYGKDYQEIRRIYKESEIPRGTVISREDLLRRTKKVMENPQRGKFEHCRICLIRWGTACS